MKRKIALITFLVSIALFIIFTIVAIVDMSNKSGAGANRVEVWASVLFVFFMVGIFSGIVALYQFIKKKFSRKDKEK